MVHENFVKMSVSAVLKGLVCFPELCVLHSCPLQRVFIASSNDNMQMTVAGRSPRYAGEGTVFIFII
jgi:hypothetical protein